ncbi:hypothetical protein PIB30_048568 [Stylosanthes scabra]|uniref:Uncharacterized protein n=1 Tax=Stylosanthes scabra TaxID=79078 RepID=A0ABU6VGI6_9FABA|nr:hypothetical protein [Stylosanthes scabra]
MGVGLGTFSQVYLPSSEDAQVAKMLHPNRESISGISVALPADRQYVHLKLAFCQDSLIGKGNDKHSRKILGVGIASSGVAYCSDTVRCCGQELFVVTVYQAS